MTLTNQASELTQKILSFHQKNYSKPETHQVISDPKASYFQYSRYYGILREIDRFSFTDFLDVGCAEGMYLLAVKKNWSKSNVFGIDFSAIALKKTRIYTNKTHSSLACADAAHLPFKNDSFDLVLCSETLEHMVDDKIAIKELLRICRKACIITVPSFSSTWAKSHFKPDIECKGDSHLRKYLRSELEDTLSQCFERVTIYNMSLWYLSSADIIMHMFLPKKITPALSHLFSNLASVDYNLCKAGEGDSPHLLNRVPVRGSPDYPSWKRFLLSPPKPKAPEQYRLKRANSIALVFPLLRCGRRIRPVYCTAPSSYERKLVY